MLFSSAVYRVCAITNLIIDKYLCPLGLLVFYTARDNKQCNYLVESNVMNVELKDFKPTACKAFLQRLIASSVLYFLCCNLVVAQNFVDFALGGNNVCAIDNGGNLECTTGSEVDTFLPPDDGTLYTAVSSGIAHSCAITQSGEMRCWGLNFNGQLESPSISASFVSLSAGANHTCAVDSNTQVHCWGSNNAGQTDVPEPNMDFVSVHTGLGSSCGVKQSGELVCWTTDTTITDTIPVNPDYTDIALGVFTQSCGLTQDGAIDCWALSNAPASVPSGGPYIEIVSNRTWLCGLSIDGQLDCNFSVPSPERFEPIIDQLPLLSSVQSGMDRTSLCGLTLEGDLACAGSVPANSLPGRQDEPLIDLPVVENLRFAAYSDTTVELFWDNRNPSSVARAITGANIYRDNEFLMSTSNGASFVDDTLVVDQEYVYRVAFVDAAGFEGQMSAPILVSTADRGQLGDDISVDTSLTHPGQPTNLSITRYGESSLEIFWDRPVGVSGESYQVFRNGEFLAFAPGPSYFDDSVNPDTAYFYTIVVVERTGVDVVGVAFVNEPALNEP